MTNKKDIEFESDKVKVYVQQLQAENALLRQANEEKNELLIKLGCPTKATAKRKVFTLEQQLKAKEQECEELKEQLIQCDDNIIVDCEYSKKDLCSFIHRKKEVINGLEQQIDQLKAENDELKNKIKELLHDCNSCNFHKYKQTLTEIKELIQSDYCTEIGSCKFCAEIGNCLNRKILQKISECEVK